ncbi:LOW QUALITY PROTEIN: hypothetical protein MAR_010139, partial [Mya arenaria]
KDDFDNVDVSDFKFQDVHRIGGLKKSGGIGDFVKDYLWKYVKFVDCNNENCLWSEFDSKLSNEKCMFGVIYIPPETSFYSSVDIFHKLESDIIDLKAEGFVTDRHSDDNVCNNYSFIELCKTLDVHIVIGRLGSDVFIGKTTCK